MALQYKSKPLWRLVCITRVLLAFERQLIYILHSIFYIRVGTTKSPRQRAGRHCFATNIASDTKRKNISTPKTSPLYTPSIPLRDLLYPHPYAPETRRINLVNSAQPSAAISSSMAHHENYILKVTAGPTYDTTTY